MNMTMKVLCNKECVKYYQHAHPESPQRILRSLDMISKNHSIESSNEAEEDDITRVHDKELIDSIKRNNFIDKDTPNIKDVFKFAKLSAGAAIEAAQTSLKGENVFSLMRPPGHHSGKNFLGGFCYFNNIAIAVAKIMNSVKKVAILDIDGHHGNGTQDIFGGLESVLFVSIHKKDSFPGTGVVSGSNCINYPIDEKTSYMKTLEEAVNKINTFNPDVIAVSAGFDTYVEDPLLGLGLEIKDYFDIGVYIETMKKPTFSVLEGGYHEDLPKCIRDYLKGFGD